MSFESAQRLYDMQSDDMDDDKDEVDEEIEVQQLAERGNDDDVLIAERAYEQIRKKEF